MLETHAGEPLPESKVPILESKVPISESKVTADSGIPDQTVRIKGLARVDRRTKKLIPRLKPGEIAIIDHQDLDGLSASGLVERRPGAVLNASPSISGRYPNSGPSILLEAGIPLIDINESAIMSLVREGRTIEIREDGVEYGGRFFPARWLEHAEVEKLLQQARSSLGAEIEAFARNTLDYIERERDLVLDRLEMPEIKTSIAQRHAVIVVRGEGYKRDLDAILPYVRDVNPVIIAVDGGADALLELKPPLKPHLIVGDMDSVSDAALRCGAEIVAHAYPPSRASLQSKGAEGQKTEEASSASGAISNGTATGSGASVSITIVPAASAASGNGAAHSAVLTPADGTAQAQTDNSAMEPPARIDSPGMERLQRLGIEAKVFSVAGTSEDMAMLIAYEKGAEIIVAVGTHFSLVDFLDKGRSGMASTFLVRLRVGSRLVDARGVGALYQKDTGLGYAWYLVAAAALPLAAIAMLSPGLRALFLLAYTVFSHWLRGYGL